MALEPDKYLEPAYIPVHFSAQDDWAKYTPQGHVISNLVGTITALQQKVKELEQKLAEK